MGLFSPSSHSRHGHRSSSHHDRHDSHSHSRPSMSRSASSFFRLANPSTHSVRSFGSHRSSSSYYKRSPRSGYISSLFRKFKHLLRELWYYAKRHPIKVFIFVIMPLISGGVLAGFARQFGIRLPAALAGKGAASAGGGYYGSAGYGGMSGGLSQGLAGGGALEGVMKIAKNFL
ncbi:hypothetical protein NA57DRAFT_76168 [Rhizodiscina lignyota]|uniref:Uncharacterized protein n=1 Tax=Rhizodiscina lignyota TaxID=1504668 RepID=A0A9P4MAN9_9PEZI|nr:hypothetical protein NA57DRAFT_76168 [Rhizodiscina lignyota]